jgi:phospholipid/cholesterol/gamma-HCH transport system substrate-binding protein
MIKEAPSIGRIVAMVVFALSCFALLLFLWLAFGGSVPLRPEGYRLTVAFPEAATLAQEADVRLAGVNVGKVKTKELDQGGRRTLVELELKERYAPIPKDSRAILRQKTLLGETYVEISQGHPSAGMLEDGGRLPDSQVEPTTELDEIFKAFDEETRAAFQDWVAELRRAIRGGRGEDLNDAFGNLEGFAVDGADLLGVLDEQEIALRRLIRNTGRVFGAINEREGALRELIVNSGNTFEATASRDEALAETFRVFPTFLDESKATLARLERFANQTRPLVRSLRRPARDLGPTVRDLGGLAPDLEDLFRDLPPLIRSGRRGLPQLERLLRGAEPLVEGLHVFLPELNPILSYLNYEQKIVANFLSVGVEGLKAPNSVVPFHYLRQYSSINARSLSLATEMPPYERGNAYRAPNFPTRAGPLGAIEVLSCDNAGGEVRDAAEGAPPCFVQPPSLWDGSRFPRLGRGEAPFVRPPGALDGTEPPRP